MLFEPRVGLGVLSLTISSVGLRVMLGRSTGFIRFILKKVSRIFRKSLRAVFSLQEVFRESSRGFKEVN